MDIIYLKKKKMKNTLLGVDNVYVYTESRKDSHGF